MWKQLLPQNNQPPFLFMDDTKLYATNDNKPEILLQVVHEFTNEINMKFGSEKTNQRDIEQKTTRYE